MMHRNPFRGDKTVNPFLAETMIGMQNRTLVETLFDRTTGTNIGDMTSGGNLAASFDGNNSQVNTACSTKVAGSPTAYVGKTLTAAYPISKIVYYGASDHGFDGAGTPTVTTRLYGKAGAAPSSATDGTMLASDSFTDPNDGTAKTLTSSDTATAYDHVWLYISHAGTNAFCAEVEIYVMA